MTFDDPDLVQYAQGGFDIGGWITLYYSATPGGPFAAVDTDAWSNPRLWGQAGDLDPGWYYGTETGNGTTYSGTSPNSNTINMP